MVMVLREPPKPYVKPPRLISEGRIQKRLRVGRGFSKLEIKEAGITIDVAKRLGIPIDPRRRSKHDWNVKALKEYIAKISKSSKSV